jgi:6,7-dimethyl-8-ribityllumazine synthase
MSGRGAPTPDVPPAPDLPVAIVASRWHDEVMGGLIDGAQRACRAGRTAEPRLIRVPGSFELPVGAAAAVDAGYQAVIALGVVIRGDTPHFDYVCNAATDQLARIAVDHRVPVGFGLLTCDNEDQAIARAGLPGSSEDKGFEAAAAAVATAMTLTTAVRHS